MASVYGNSLCTLAATASCNSQGGLFRKRSKFGLGICAEDEDDTMLLVSEGAANEMLSDIERAPLQKVGQLGSRPRFALLILCSKRGWVLQERLLSRRMIHFTRQQLVWQCEELNACEALPDGFSVSSIKLPVKLGVKIGSRAPDIDLLEAWDGILSRYTSASLTRRSDLLPALSGIATHLQKLTGAAYLAGIWNLHPESFLMHLGWRSEPPIAHRSREYRAPSWSWASTENRIKLFPFEYDRYFYTIEMMSLNVAAGSKVIRADVVPVSKDPHGSVSAGMLILEGPLNEIVVRPGIKNPDLNGTSLGMEIFLDEPLSTEKTLFTLPLYHYYVPHLDLELGDDGTELIFLLLLRGDENYTRYGVGRWFWTDGVNYPDIWDKIVTTCSNPSDEDYKFSNRKEVHIV
ncbi:hypothetical protein BBAD15_g8854 [Beauveria bassiana D1-5]|uniref:Heterokaryon incompatibility domain-containing protein n=1 Tax=Beauveria bassiana D1-5 TaxID=1245745 RepID=A0A0A2VE90_BEABA|nr:hypothetical protein BBAD15_g8854 [Beauveria bassiana D1-5]